MKAAPAQSNTRLYNRGNHNTGTASAVHVLCRNDCWSEAQEEFC